jgi:hypothetical protein
MPVGKQSLSADDEFNLTFVGLVCDCAMNLLHIADYWWCYVLDYPVNNILYVANMPFCM